MRLGWQDYNMSANNQTLIKKHEGQWYVFADISAESWGNLETMKKNTLSIKHADGVYNSPIEAYRAALEIDNKQGQFEEGTEYGVRFNTLCKDDAEIILVE